MYNWEQSFEEYKKTILFMYAQWPWMTADMIPFVYEEAQVEMEFLKNYKKSWIGLDDDDDDD